MDDENKQLQRLLDDATLKREAAQDRLRGLEDQCEHAKGNLINALSSDVSESSLKQFNSHATIQELAQKASSILIDLKDREQGFSKKDQQANAALSSAANKILALERDMQAYHQALHETCGGLETSLAGVDNAVVQQTLRDSKHVVRAKNPRPTSVDEDKILFVHDLVSMVNATVQLLAKSQKRSSQLLKLVNKKNEMLIMVAASLRQQTAQVSPSPPHDACIPLPLHFCFVFSTVPSRLFRHHIAGGRPAQRHRGDGRSVLRVGHGRRAGGARQRPDGAQARAPGRADHLVARGRVRAHGRNLQQRQRARGQPGRRSVPRLSKGADSARWGVRWLICLIMLLRARLLGAKEEWRGRSAHAPLFFVSAPPRPIRPGLAPHSALTSPGCCRTTAWSANRGNARARAESSETVFPPRRNRHRTQQQRTREKSTGV